VSIILIIVTIPLVIATLIISIFVAAITALMLVGLFNLFVGNVLAWVLGILFVLPLLFVLALSPWVLVGAWQAVFTSTVWTLTYREIKALPVIVATEVPATG
jgi:predicted membrane protein